MALTFSTTCVLRWSFVCTLLQVTGNRFGSMTVYSFPGICEPPPPPPPAPPAPCPLCCVMDPVVTVPPPISEPKLEKCEGGRLPVQTRNEFEAWLNMFSCELRNLDGATPIIRARVTYTNSTGMKTRAYI